MNEILIEELEKLQADIIDRHTKAGQVASGKTRDSFEVKVSENRGQLLGEAWVGVLEVGRSGGKVPYNFKQIILDWANAKGIKFSSPSQANSFAWFVSNKIKNEGTKLYRSGKTIDIFTTAVEEFEKRLRERLSDKLSIDIENNIFQ